MSQYESCPLTQENFLNSENSVTNQDPLVAQILDSRYLIEKRLDQGGIGTVYLAKHLKLLGKQVVVKVLRDVMLEDPEVRRKFEHEKESLIRLNHPNIVNILDAGTMTDGQPFLVMQYLEGRSLRRAIEHERLPLGICAKIIETIGDALSASHAQGILHRDLKPENIVLVPNADGTERAVLIDFGIARVADSKIAPATEIERGIGTIWYMAPEQLQGSLKLTPACDIYSLGVVAYELLTGERPFKPSSHYEMLKLQSEGVKTPPRALNPNISPTAEMLIMQALEYEPTQRPQNARAFGQALANALLVLNDASDFSSNHDLPPSVATILSTVPNFPSVSQLKSPQPSIKQPEKQVTKQPPIANGLRKFLLGALSLALFAGATNIAFRFFVGNPYDNIQIISTQPAASQNTPQKSAVTHTATQHSTQDLSVGSISKDHFGMEFVWIPAGSFTMGAENGDDDEKPVRQVAISEGFWLGRHEVTQGEWKKIMGSNPSYFQHCDKCPVESVSFEDVQQFIETLNAEVKDGYIYRLPTEAEWEYAAREGQSGKDFSGVLQEAAWYIENSEKKTHPVKLKQPNGWGLYDMHGNVWEWVQDFYAPYDSKSLTDPTGPKEGTTRVLRGGSWNYAAAHCRLSNRITISSGLRLNDVGLRLVRIHK